MVRPFLKWAGGKRQLLPELRKHYPAGFDRYVEPFLGSGAVFFDLFSAGRLKGRGVELVDLNADLIGCYRMLRDRTAAVITALEALAAEHRIRGASCYYDVRDGRFNPIRVGGAGGVGGVGRVSRAGEADGGYTPELAAMLIYLNRTGFNGLFRLNRAGAFNVPAGRYVNPRICDADLLSACASALRMPRLTLARQPFEETLARTGAGDFVYCDPPYAPMSATSLFAQYTADGFTGADHRRLHTAILDAAARGAVVVLSNSSAPEITAAYSSRKARKAGLHVQRVPARRAINSRASARGPVEELIISNVPFGTVASAFRLKTAMAKASLRARDPHQLSATGTRERQPKI